MQRPTVSRTFSTKRGSFESLKASLRRGWSPKARQTRWLTDGAGPAALAIIVRSDQCVAPSGVVSGVSRTSARHVDRPAPDDLEAVAPDDDRRVLVDADAELARVMRRCPEQPSDTAALVEVLVDNDVPDQSETVGHMQSVSVRSRIRPQGRHPG